MPIRVAVDAVGGDYAPGVVIEGALRYLGANPGAMHLLLCGPQPLLKKELSRQAPHGHPQIELVHAPHVIGMGESPVAAVRGKPHSSMHVGLKYVREGKAEAFVSAGNTGALAVASLAVLGRLPGIMRPTIPTGYPTVKGECVVVDVGSNMDSKPEHLLQFAQMGAVYSSRVKKISNPRVALLSVGEEPSKGNELVRATFRLLDKADGLNFIGNIEGGDLLLHKADVVVCDGFVGNVLLKLTESFSTVMPLLIRRGAESHGFSDDDLNTFMPVLDGALKRFLPSTYGGSAPLLGVNGPVLVLHGRSDADTFEYALPRALPLIAAEFPKAMRWLLGGMKSADS